MTTIKFMYNGIKIDGKLLIVITIIIAGVIIFYNQTKIPDWVKVNQEMVELCTMSGDDVECD